MAGAWLYCLATRVITFEVPGEPTAVNAKGEVGSPTSWHGASFRQAIPREQLAGFIVPREKDGGAGKLTSCVQNV